MCVFTYRLVNVRVDECHITVVVQHIFDRLMCFGAKAPKKAGTIRGNRVDNKQEDFM